jgi:hypothetical protein
MEMETDGYDTVRHLGHDAYEPAMCAPGASLTIWAPCRTAGRGELDDELLLFEANRIDLQTCPMRKHGREERGQMHEGNSTNGDETTRASAPVVLPPQPAVREAPQLDKSQFDVAVDIEQEAEEKGGVQQVLADHFAKVYKVTRPLRANA